MEYTKRDLELVQILRDNFEKIRVVDPENVLDLLRCSRNLFLKENLISGGDDMRLRRLIEFKLPPLSEWEHPKKWYPWNLEDTEPRIKFLDDLIAKIKNSLST